MQDADARAVPTAGRCHGDAGDARGSGATRWRRGDIAAPKIPNAPGMDPGRGNPTKSRGSPRESQGNSTEPGGNTTETRGNPTNTPREPQGIPREPLKTQREPHKNLRDPQGIPKEPLKTPRDPPECQNRGNSFLFLTLLKPGGICRTRFKILLPDLILMSGYQATTFPPDLL